MLDLADEYYTEQDIRNIFKFIEENNGTVSFRTRFKNYIMDKKYIDGFNPLRCFKVDLQIIDFINLYGIMMLFIKEK